MRDDSILYDSDTIFHYTTAAVALEHILHSQRLKLSALKDTGDPREYKDWLIATGGWSLPDDFEQLVTPLNETLNRAIRSEYRIGCFCRNLEDTGPDPSRPTMPRPGSGFARSRMWSQYAEDHRGVCIGLSSAALRARAEQELGADRVFVGTVTYTDSPVAFKDRNLDGNAVVEQGVDSYCRSHIRKRKESIFLTKHTDYRDESEFRILAEDPSGEAQFLDISDCVRVVLVGDRFHDAYLPLIEAACKRLGAESRRVYWSNGDPHVIDCRPRTGSSS